MKIRQGFVSNSSSSSFVALGIQLDTDVFEKMGGYEFFETKFDYVDWPEGEKFAIVGTRIGRWSDNDGEINSLSLEELENERLEVTKTLDAVFPDGNKKPTLLFGLTY